MNNQPRWTTTPNTRLTAHWQCYWLVVVLRSTVTTTLALSGRDLAESQTRSGSQGAFPRVQSSSEGSKIRVEGEARRMPQILRRHIAFLPVVLLAYLLVLVEVVCHCFATTSTFLCLSTNTRSSPTAGPSHIRSLGHAGCHSRFLSEYGRYA